ncbi:hypothetical protein AAFF_G00035340 [Aldrovandia affinis]|uniref:Uncharacterized protein n=1 Tax=Aldrovandia affinis TaxID=143900 RepID=A0AAD7S352_9TELE|nr:hypothetical protein AAFF_G00035340 [Aldrovandia affinis]
MKRGCGGPRDEPEEGHRGLLPGGQKDLESRRGQTAERQGLTGYSATPSKSLIDVRSVESPSSLSGGAIAPPLRSGPTRKS